MLFDYHASRHILGIIEKDHCLCFTLLHFDLSYNMLAASSGCNSRGLMSLFRYIPIYWHSRSPVIARGAKHRVH